VISGNCLELHRHRQDLISQTGQFGRRQAGFETGSSTIRDELDRIRLSFARDTREQLGPLNDSAPRSGDAFACPQFLQPDQLSLYTLCGGK
jgi:hypothetical protein